MNIYVKCALAAVGLDAVTALENVAYNTLKRAAVKILEKVASRMCGPIGVGIAVVSYTLCINNIS